MNNTVTRQELGKVAMTSRGEYDTSKSYEILDIVTYQGSSYLSKKYDNDSLPTNANDWQLLAQKGDTYELSEEDLQRIAKQITSNANSAFNQNVKEKTDSFNSNANSKTEAYNTNATEKLGTYNSNHTAKLKEYNDNATSKLSAYNTNTVTKTNEYNSNHTNKLNAYDTNASNKVDVYNTNADTRLEEYNTNADNKIAEYDEHSKELNNKIVSTRNELERLKSNVLNTGEDTDTFIHLEDSAMAELQEIKVDGVLQQNTTTGKNKIDTLAKITNIDGLTITRQENGTLLINGSSAEFAVSDAVKAQALKAGTYTISVKLNNTEIKANVYYSIGDNQNQIYKYKDVTPLTLTFDTNFTLTRIQPYFNASTYNNATLSIQLEEGSNATEYEPFTNGASPNPDYPQEIKTITGSLKVTSCGKNLFNFDNMLDNMAWSENGLVGNSLAIAVNKHQDIHSSAITFSVDFNQNSGTQGRLLVYDKNKTLISNNAIVTFPFTKVFESNAKYYTYYFLKSQIPINSKIQLELSNTASEYEPYVESQIQAKLPENEFIGKLYETYKDTLRTEYFPKEGQYHLMLDKKVGKYVFTGNENIVLFSSANDIKQYYYILNTCLSITNQQLDNIYVMSNYFKGVAWQNSWTKNNTVTIGLNKRLFIYSKEFTSIDDLKNFLSTHNTEVYYVLAKPYTLDLGAIDMPMSYKDITNIFTDGDLLPTINAKYYRVFDKTIQNVQINEKTLKQEITDLNATVSDLDTRLKALETKTVEEPTESEGTV